MIVETMANATLQDFADDRKQGYRSVVSSRFFLIFLVNGRNIGRFPFRRQSSRLQRVIEQRTKARSDDSATLL